MGKRRVVKRLGRRGRRNCSMARGTRRKNVPVERSDAVVGGGRRGRADD